MYDVLPSEGFRFLRMHPPGSTQEIECTLEVWRISAAPPYRALSYTWDNPYGKDKDDAIRGIPEPQESAFITCNGKTVNVTRNAYDALSRVRDDFADMLIWIDSVCINQQDAQERASQIALMGNLYSSAFQVLVWLGPEKEGLEELSGACKIITEAVEFSAEDFPGGPIKFGSAPAHNPIAAVSWSKSPLMKALAYRDICRWWHRAWTVQEYLLASEVLLIAGPYNLSWLSLMGLAFAETESHFQDGDNIYDPTDVFHGARRVARTYYDFKSLCLAARTASLPESPRIRLSWDQIAWLYRVEEKEMMFALIFDIFILLTTKQVTKPHDKVYAAFGIIDYCRPSLLLEYGLHVDYSRSLEDVWIDVFSIILDRIGSLYPLRFAIGKSQESFNSLSWLPHPGSLSQRLAQQRTSLGPKQWLPYFGEGFKRHILNHRLCLRGARFDTISMVQKSSSFTSRAEVNLDTCAYFEWLSIVQGKLHYQDQSRCEVLWRTLICNQIDDDKAHTEAFRAILLASISEAAYNTMTAGTSLESVLAILEKTLLTLQHESPQEFPSLSEVQNMIAEISASGIKTNYIALLTDSLSSEAHKVALHMFDRALWLHDELTQPIIVRSSRGFLAQTRHTVLPGDEIWLVEGADEPYVLRPTQEDGTYEFMGDCYLHGLMHGEIFKPEWEMEEKIHDIMLI